MSRKTALTSLGGLTSKDKKIKGQEDQMTRRSKDKKIKGQEDQRTRRSKDKKIS